ncbi:MobC family plasmid mobilization relaxosome protein [Brucella anthropi]|nr:MobC family plasmid mobilization relaxosome protein [Brucella anthropi]
MRDALGLTEARRRRPAPKVDPELVRAVARIGGNLNQIARWLNTAQAQGQVSAIDAITVAARLVAIERALSKTLEQFTAKDGAPC